jgi:cytochrome c oxidase subunit 2
MAKPVTLGPPRDVSLDGHLVDGVFGYLTIATTICFAIVVLVMLASVLFHRAGPRRQAFYTHGDRWRDTLLTLAVGYTMFLAVDAVLAGRSLGELETHFWRFPEGDPAAVHVEVTARQWAWTFRTAGPDGRFGTRDDIVTLNELRIPAGRPIYLKLRSKDVIHSLYLPNFRTKIDAVPGTTTRLWFQATVPGQYELGCAQHCGVSHYRMRGELIVTEPARYDTWLNRATLDAQLHADPADGTAGDAWEWEPG